MKIGDNEISKSLLSLEGKKNDFTFIDCDRTDGQYITFVRVKDAIKSFEKQYIRTDFFIKPNFKLMSASNYYTYSNITDKSRNLIKIGKFIKTIGDFKNTQIEEFINLFKSTKSSIDGLKFEIVSGTQIADWYSSTKYCNNKWSQLHSSCMANSPKETFDIYVKNPDVCKMLILKIGDKLAGRALIWKLDKPIDGCEFYMDRVYSMEDHQKNAFRDYAINNKWCYRGTEHNHTIFGYKDLYKSELKVSIKNIKHEKYPYMDTFKSLDRKELSNKYDEKGFGILISRTDGTYVECIPSFKNKFLRFLHIK
jgi:hypothetical protein